MLKTEHGTPCCNLAIISNQYLTLKLYAELN